MAPLARYLICLSLASSSSSHVGDVGRLTESGCPRCRPVHCQKSDSGNSVPCSCLQGKIKLSTASHCRPMLTFESPTAAMATSQIYPTIAETCSFARFWTDWRRAVFHHDLNSLMEANCTEAYRGLIHDEVSVRRESREEA